MQRSEYFPVPDELRGQTVCLYVFHNGKEPSVIFHVPWLAAALSIEETGEDQVTMVYHDGVGNRLEEEYIGDGGPDFYDRLMETLGCTKHESEA